MNDGTKHRSSHFFTLLQYHIKMIQYFVCQMEIPFDLRVYNYLQCIIGRFYGTEVFELNRNEISVFFWGFTFLSTGQKSWFDLETEFADKNDAILWNFSVAIPTMRIRGVVSFTIRQSGQFPYLWHVVQHFFRMVFVEHEESLDLSRTHWLAVLHHTLRKLTSNRARFFPWTAIKTTEHLLNLTHAAPANVFLHVHSPRPHQRCIQALEIIRRHEQYSGLRRGHTVQTVQ